jgi:outer membrane immunogenic protein
MRKFVLAASVAVVGAFAAMAEAGDITASAGYTVFDAEDGTLGALSGRLSYDLAPNFGIEGEVGFGIVDEDITVGTVTATVELSNYLGIFGVAKFPVSEQLSLHGRLGYATTELEASAPGASVSDDVNGFAFGAGGTYMVNETIGLRGDYTRFEGEDDASADLFGVSIVFKFGA